MNVWVVLPTYNERENLQEALVRLFALPISALHVLVVDDGSPDGTGDLAEALKEHYPQLHVLHRSGKGGLASAYLAGFRYALERGADYLFEMDADLSHPAAVLPTMLAACSDADLVLGSRYVPGGATENWNWVRRWVSRVGNWYARSILQVPIRDLTGGLKCFRRATLEKIHLEAVSSTGYNFQIEMTFKVFCKGMKVVEVPITFTERRLGRSKFHLRIILESTLRVWQLRQLRSDARWHRELLP